MTYYHTYHIYKNNFIKFGLAVSEECDDDHRDTRFLYIKYTYFNIAFIRIMTNE